MTRASFALLVCRTVGVIGALYLVDSASKLSAIIEMRCLLRPGYATSMLGYCEFAGGLGLQLGAGYCGLRAPAIARRVRRSGDKADPGRMAAAIAMITLLALAWSQTTRLAIYGLMQPASGSTPSHALLAVALTGPQVDRSPSWHFAMALVIPLAGIATIARRALFDSPPAAELG